MNFIKIWYKYLSASSIDQHSWNIRTEKLNTRYDNWGNSGWQRWTRFSEYHASVAAHRESTVEFMGQHDDTADCKWSIEKITECHRSCRRAFSIFALHFREDIFEFRQFIFKRFILGNSCFGRNVTVKTKWFFSFLKIVPCFPRKNAKIQLAFYGFSYHSIYFLFWIATTVVLRNKWKEN